VKVRGSLFSQGVDNIKIAVKLPDGTVLNAVTDSNGQAVIQQIPKGTYYVDAQGLVESKSVLAQVASNSSAVQLSMTAPIEIAAIATVVVVFIALVILFLRRRRRNDTLERKRIERRAVRAARS
jgi:fructose-1,6-bisphosphatase/sedoheptulose 1,7-bisphosphatase-like protein